MRLHRAQALMAGLAVIPLVTIIAVILVSGLHTWSEASRLYAESLDKRYIIASQHAEIHYNGSSLIIENNGPVPIRLSKAILLLGNASTEISLNNTVLYPGENKTIEAGDTITGAYVVTGDGVILNADPLNPVDQYNEQRLVFRDNMTVNYTGLFLGGYTVRIGTNNWELLDKQGIIYYPSNWSFDSDDLAIIDLEPSEKTIIHVELQAYKHYIFDHGVLEDNGTLTQGEYGGYKAYAGAQGFELSIGSPRKTLNESWVEENMVPWYGKEGRIYTQVLLLKPSTSSASTFSVKVEDEGGKFQKTFTGTRLVFWITFNPKTGDEAICWDEEFNPSNLEPASGTITIEWTSGSYIDAVAKHYYEANYLLDLDVETNNTWVEYMSRNITMPLSKDSETRLPIYSDNQSVEIVIYYPSITTMQTNLESINITLWSSKTIYVWSLGNGSLAISGLGSPSNIKGATLSLTRLQNSASRIELVQTISKLTVTGIPLGAQLTIGNETLSPAGDTATVEVRGVPPRTITVVVPIAVGITSNGEEITLTSSMYLDTQGYLVEVNLPSTPTVSKLYITVPPGAEPEASNTSCYIVYGSWMQVIIDNPPSGDSLSLLFPYG